MGDSWLCPNASPTSADDGMFDVVVMLEHFHADWKRSNSNFASNFIDLTSLRYFPVSVKML